MEQGHLSHRMLRGNQLHKDIFMSIYPTEAHSFYCLYGIYPIMKECIAFDELNATLKATGDSTRLRILCLLDDAELTVSELTEILRQSQPRISRHLKLLVEAGLVERFREGNWAFFRLAERGGSTFAHAM